MKHLEYLFDRGLIEIGDLNLNEADNTEGQSIAKALGIRLVGYWEDAKSYLFNDDEETGTSFLAKDIDEARKKLKEKRKEFGLAYA